MDTYLNKNTPFYEIDQYFSISLNHQTTTIEVTYIHIKQNIKDIFTGISAKKIMYEILLKYSPLINKFHIAYLAREITKAEICMVLKQKYIQS
uniref:hypothetical protein n=1 Tax=Rhodaphanes brevistipitata TaxID=446136 RepID=UPI001FCD8743|nr:hypothetical protein MW432_pgp150 [Rhodaphanes brevistipitata]UNJ18431.1 hypothetical protein [Rhodaphanes brevistipitata]